LAFCRMARHHQVNNLVWRAVFKANIPAIKEPSGLVRDDGKRPDGSTLIPRLAGKSLAWDVTVVSMVDWPRPISQSPPVQAVQQSMLWPESRQNTHLSQAPTFFNRWLWRPSVPSTQLASHSFPNWVAD